MKNGQPTNQEILEAISAASTRTDARLDGIEYQLGAVEAEVNGMKTRLDGIDGRLDGIDGRLDGMDGRLGNVETRMATKADLEALDQRYIRKPKVFRWMM